MFSGRPLALFQEVGSGPRYRECWCLTAASTAVYHSPNNLYYSPNNWTWVLPTMPENQE